MVTKNGVLRNDGDGHWYLIPEELKKEYLSVEETISNADSYSEEWNSAIEYFEETFGKYRLPGGVGELLIPMEDEE